MVVLAATLAAGIALGAWYPGGWAVGGGLVAAAIPVLVLGTVRGRAQALAPLLVVLGLGYLSLQPWMAPRAVEGHAVRWADGPAVPLQGKVTEVPRVTAGRQQFILALEKPPAAPASGPHRGLVRVTVRGTSPSFFPGETLAFTARLRRPRNFNNPGGFDYRRHLCLQGVRTTAYVAADRVERLDLGPPEEPGALMARLRRHVGALIADAAPHDRGAVIRALTIGDRQGISPALRDAFNRAGVGHLLAISGLHVGIVAALVYGVWVRLLVWWPLMVRRAWTAKGAALATALAVWGYGLMAGLSPSTQRATMMVSAYLGALLLERDPDLPSTLTLAAVILLVVHPPVLFSVSFQLSFAAVVWILAGVRRPSGSSGQRPWERLSRWARQFALVSLWAILGTLPLVMQHFHQVSLVGLGANFLFVPWMGMLVVPVALAGSLAALIHDRLSLGIFKVCDWILAPALDLLGLLAAWPSSAVATFTPRLLEIALYYAALALVVVWWRHRQAVTRHRRVVAALVVAAALAADGLYWGYRRFWHRDLRATVLDVGQGAAAVIEAPGGRVILVDGGGFADNAAFDVGQRIVAPFLRHQKIGAIDLVVLTHADADHLNGLLHVLDVFPVARVWSNQEAADTLGYRKFTETIARRRIPWPAFATLPREYRLGATRIEVLHPPRDFRDQAATQNWCRGNNNSIVVRISAAGRAILFTGDIEAPAEAALVAADPAALKADVLVLPHHGSRSSSTPGFLAAVAPAAAVASCGWRNRYGWPHPQVVRQVAEQGIDLWRTDLDGAVTLHFTARWALVRPFLVRPKDGRRHILPARAPPLIQAAPD
jgi:competence protein ComEC